jgi:hypothetical protein
MGCLNYFEGAKSMKAKASKKVKVKVRGEDVMMTKEEISETQQRTLEHLDKTFKEVLGYWDAESKMLEVLGNKKRQRDAWVKMIQLRDALNEYIEFCSK